MRTDTSQEIDAWLGDGGWVIASSDRAARAAISGFHQTQQSDGRKAWTAPSVLSWKNFLVSAWESHTVDGRLILNATQEHALWESILAESGLGAALLEGPRHRLAAMAMEAHALLCGYAPRFLRLPPRLGWAQDAGEFSKWLETFEDVCRRNRLLSASRLPLELLPRLEADGVPRAPLLLVGFDRLIPTQRELLDAWGKWQETIVAAPATDIQFYRASNVDSELAACAKWCKQELAANPEKKLLVIAQNASRDRGRIERAFLQSVGTGRRENFEISLGIPLAQVPLARSGLLLLRWLTSAIEEHEVDWLLQCEYATTSAEETEGLQRLMRSLRRRGLERTSWSLDTLANQTAGSAQAPKDWVRRMREAQKLLQAAGRREQTAFDWAEFVPKLLEVAGWPGARALASEEFQAMKRWLQVLEVCASLGFDGKITDWRRFLATLGRTLNETLFTLESQDVPILIAGPAESAGLTADAVWFLGATEEGWPARGSMHPLLPAEVQRNFSMPHATSQLDWELARAITLRLLGSANEVRLSCSMQADGVETSASRLVTKIAGEPKPLPRELADVTTRSPQTISVNDLSRISLKIGGTATLGEASARPIPGGSTVLTSQSQCPFKAFATARLGADTWQLAQPGLTPAVRGQLLHDVMHSVWSGPPAGLRSLNELRLVADRKAFIAVHVEVVLERGMPAAALEQMPPPYLLLEKQRLVRLVSEWLEFELARESFEVVKTEVQRQVRIGDLPLTLRLDRIDRLNDGTLLVVDYKTGDVSAKSWELPRPDDIQLPLYSSFALHAEETVGGLVFAKVRPGEHCFAGRVGDAHRTISSSLGPRSALVKDALNAELLIDWKDAIEQLARDFLSGRADVDPRDYPTTCKRCGLQTLCRVQETYDRRADEDVLDAEEVDA